MRISNWLSRYRRVRANSNLTFEVKCEYRSGYRPFDFILLPSRISAWFIVSVRDAMRVLYLKCLQSYVALRTYNSGFPVSCSLISVIDLMTLTEIWMSGSQFQNYWTEWRERLCTYTVLGLADVFLLHIPPSEMQKSLSFQRLPNVVLKND